MTRAITFALALMLGTTMFASTAEAKKDKGWAGPPPHAKAYGYYKKGWPGYERYNGGYPPPIYVWPPAYPTPFDAWHPAPLPAPEELPPPPPTLPF
jgi:hypothetical protein